MNARHVIEALFQSGAAFFDTTGKGYLSSSGAVYVPMPAGTIGSGVQKFIDVWSRGKDRRNEIVSDFVNSFQFLVDNYGLGAVFVTPEKVVVVSRGGNPLDLSKEHQQWLSDHFQIAFETDVLVVDKLSGYARKVIPAAVALFGADEMRYHRERHGKKKTWTPYGTPEDYKFAKQVHPEPKYSGVSQLPATSNPAFKTPVHSMRFIKGGGANVHPKARMYGVESQGE